MEKKSFFVKNMWLKTTCFEAASLLFGSDLVFVGRCKAGVLSLGAEFPQPPGGLALSAVSTCVASLTPPLCSRQGQMVSVSLLTLPWTQAHRNAAGGGGGGGGGGRGRQAPSSRQKLVVMSLSVLC